MILVNDTRMHANVDTSPSSRWRASIAYLSGVPLCPAGGVEEPLAPALPRDLREGEGRSLEDVEQVEGRRRLGTLALCFGLFFSEK